ncbi:MAG: peptidase [Gammaproteobacteria bacterium]|nr:peptidase [Gammaproteobacteria bacterium]MBT8151524.1 peptidase [Gammaproteobacteria bacterium]NNM10349.1 peptidase [Pseudomonadales bacterium]RZV55688.1 MAG: peptidase [Pseudomonadales bacterium]
MTYCLAIRLEAGLVFCTDSRTNAGADQVNTYSKLHRFSQFDDRELVILSAGNLATTQAVLTTVRRDIRDDEVFDIGSAEHITEIADYVGRLSVETQAKYAASGPEAGFNASATFIVGGQIEGQDPQVYMVYPEGNHITVARQHPFLQIGETKYGKPVLERIVRADTSPSAAMQCALVSMDSTMRSNATVGPPIELLFCPENAFKTGSEYQMFEEGDDYLGTLGKVWDEKIRRAFEDLPPLPPMPRAKPAQ